MNKKSLCTVVILVSKSHCQGYFIFPVAPPFLTPPQPTKITVTHTGTHPLSVPTDGDTVITHKSIQNDDCLFNLWVIAGVFLQHMAVVHVKQSILWRWEYTLSRQIIGETQQALQTGVQAETVSCKVLLTIVFILCPNSVLVLNQSI